MMAAAIRVLYVDDESNLLEICKLFLEESGDFIVTTAMSAGEGTQLLEQGKFDAIISDYQMPGMDGIQFLVEVRSRFGPIPFILFTGRGREEVVIQAINSGADFYLQKGGEPVAQFAELSHKIKAAASSKRAGDALRESEKQQRLTLDATNDGIWDWNIPSGIAFFSPRWYTMIGYEAGEMPGTYATWRSLLHPEDLGPTEKRIQGHIGQKDESYTVEFRMRTKAGDWKWILARGKVVERDGAGNPVRMVGTHTDITERKHAEESMRQNEALLKRTGEIARVGGWEMDAETLAVTWTEETYHIHGVPVGQIPPLEGAINFFHPDERAKLSDAITRALTTGEGYDMELRFITATGKHLWTRTVCQPKVVDGKTIRLEGTFQDITDRKQAEEELLKKTEELHASYEEITATEEELRANLDELTRQEQALRESEANLRAILDATPFPIALVDLQDNNINFWSRSAHTLFGHTAPTTNEWYQLAYPDPDYRRDVINRWKPHLEEAKLSGQPVNTGEYRVTCHDGSVRLCELYATFLADKLIVTFNDITERKRVELERVSALERIKETNHLAHIGTWDWVIETDTVTWSEELCNIAGWDPSLPAPTYAELPRCYTPSSWDLLSDAVTRALTTGEPYNLELEMIRPDGSIRWTNAFGGVNRNENGKVIGLHGSVQDITERKQAEEALRETNEYLNNLFDYANAPIIVWNPAFEITRFNHAFEDLTLLSEQEVIGQRLDILFPKESRDTSLLQIKKTLEGEHWKIVEIPIRVKDGSVRTVLWNSANILDPDGWIISTIAQGVDITERKHAHDVMRVSEARYRSYIDVTGQIAWITNADGEIMEDVPSFRKFTGQTYEEAKGSGWGKALHPEDLERTLQVWNEAVAAKAPYETEYRMRRHDGVYRYLLARGFPVFTEDRNIREWVGTLIDITERKRAEEAQREANGYLNNLFDYANAPIIVWDPNFVITRFNHAFEDLTLISEQEVIGQRLDILFPKESRDTSLLQIKKTLEGERWETVEIPILVKDGSVRTVLWNSANILDPDGWIISTIAQGVDITDRKVAEEALIQANKKLTLLSGITRHDINNQLTGLRGYLTLLEKKQPDHSFIEYFQKINAAAQRISTMIQFTKEYEKIGVNSPVWQNCRTLVDTAAKQAPLGQVIVKNDLPAGTEVFADPLIEKVFYNLMDNAVRYGGKITIIRFSVEEAGEDNLIVCEDDGDGVVVWEKEKIFERGFGKNTGMGLALSWEILSITSITIKETGEPGKGARFEMTVPKGVWRTVGKKE